MSMDYRDRLMLLAPETSVLSLSDTTYLEEITDQIVFLAAGPCSLAKTPGKDNWVDDTGGLPNYICHIARALHREKGMPVGRAIAIAVSRVKVWASGGGDVDADTRAKAAKAVTEWEAKKARAHADNKK